ncbi:MULTISPECIES: ATP/GTP-binding protein [unclassified Streptomyces]|uniref:ATP/GTP-binding protein n=1 Tax=unclassified Streptomyces TaxID=2593676 RepID=UPI0033E916D2
MSPRRNRPRGTTGSPQETDGPGWGRGGERTESWQGEEWTVRPLAGSSGGKRYRCPGCDQEIPPGVGHLVVWPEYGGVDDRRHWHTACWNARDRRGVRPQRSRNAPRH